MNKVNWGRVVLGTLIAAVVSFLTDGFMHEVLLKADWKATFDALHATPPADEHGTSMAYFGLLEIGRGLTGMVLYVMMRARMKAGPKTAALAGLVTWFAFSLTGPAQYVPLGLLSSALWLKAAGFQFLPTLVATIAGAAPYKERR